MTQPIHTLRFDAGLHAEIHHDLDAGQPYLHDDAVRIVVLHGRYIDPAHGACGRDPDQVARWQHDNKGEWFTIPLFLCDIDPARWTLRNDTFPGNLGLFRPANVSPEPSGGVSLVVIEEALGVRNLSAAAISSQGRFLFGRFEITLQATNVPGVVTGFFLHRNSPRQEINVEITGNRPDRLLVNVFYNPGSEGAKFDYGYRGTPVSIALGFDASRALHRYAIEWGPSEIRWFVDDELVHHRAMWDPTPIPHLPMALHVNTWPTRSKELAGRLALRALPASTIVRQIAVDAGSTDTQSPPALSS